MIYILMVVSTFYLPSFNSSVITFQEFNSKAQCEQVAKMINDNYGRKIATTKEANTSAQCISKDGEKNNE